MNNFRIVTKILLIIGLIILTIKCVNSLESRNEDDMKLLADSKVDFSSTQGDTNWYYGYYDSLFIPADFKLLNQFIVGGSYGTGWYISNDYWTCITAEGAGPNSVITSYGKTNVDHWPVRRWASSVDGVLYISGRLAKIQTHTASDGVTGYIYLNDELKWSKNIGGQDVKGCTFSIKLSIKLNQTIDFVISPNNTDWADYSLFTAVIKIEN